MPCRPRPACRSWPTSARAGAPCSSTCSRRSGKPRRKRRGRDKHAHPDHPPELPGPVQGPGPGPAARSGRVRGRHRQAGYPRAAGPAPAHLCAAAPGGAGDPPLRQALRGGHPVWPGGGAPAAAARARRVRARPRAGPPGLGRDAVRQGDFPATRAWCISASSTTARGADAASTRSFRSRSTTRARIRARNALFAAQPGELRRRHRTDRLAKGPHPAAFRHKIAVLHEGIDTDAHARRPPGQLHPAQRESCAPATRW